MTEAYWARKLAHRDADPLEKLIASHSSVIPAKAGIQGERRVADGLSECQSLVVETGLE
jgi:hypothetical protein